MMDFGAIVCKPVNPDCKQCVFINSCYAFQHDLIKKLPFKKNKTRIRNRWFYYFRIEYKNKIFIKIRSGSDIWKNLYEFVLIEMEGKTEINKVLKLAIKKKILEKDRFAVQSVSINYSQLLSHQKIKGQFIYVKTQKRPILSGFKAVSKKEMGDYPFPKFINSYIRE
jgi:A/G-specific adenine glycosylase